MTIYSLDVLLFLFAQYPCQLLSFIHVKCQAGWSISWIKIARRNINNLRYADDTTLMAESEEELKSLLMKENEKVGLKLNIQKAKMMPSNPITSWQTDGETMEILTDFIFLGSKTTINGDCTHDFKRRLLLRWKAMINLDSILKSQRHYFANKGPSRQSYGFSSSHVWM